MVDACAVEDVAAGEGADGAGCGFVGFVAEVAEGLAGPLFFEVVVSGVWGWTAEGGDGGVFGGGGR